MRSHGSPEQLEKRRKRAVAMLEEGYQPVNVAKMLKVDRRSVRRWKAAYLRDGILGAVGRLCPTALTQYGKRTYTEKASGRVA